MNKCVVSLITAFLVRVCESASFQNLGFDEYDPSTRLLPGWHIEDRLTDGRNNTSEGVLIGVNELTAGLNYATLYDNNISPGAAFGKYSLRFVPGIDGNGDYVPFSLSQTGDVPADAKSIHFVDFGGPFELRINDFVVPLIYNSPPDFIYGVAAGDVSMFAGQSVELDFTTLRSGGPNGIDEISFSPQIAPEPTTWLLFGLGGLGLLAGRKIFR